MRAEVSTPIAFILVLLVWSTTPLAISLSVADRPLLAVALRMLIGCAFCYGLLRLRGQRLPNQREDLWQYAIAGGSLYVTMILVYQAAVTVPSGWIAVIFGLSPIVTGVISLPFEKEAALTPIRGAGLVLGFGGLYLVFAGSLSLDQAHLYGLLLVFIGMFVASASSVALRLLVRDSSTSGLQITTGGLVFAVPLYFATAVIAEPWAWPNFDTQHLLAMLYLGVIGSGVAMVLYFSLLKRLPATKLALMMLITPIAALALGSLINNEPVVASVWLGAICVSVGILIYEFKPRFGLRRL